MIPGTAGAEPLTPSARARRWVNAVTLSTPAGLLIARVAGLRAEPGPDGLLLAGGYRLPVPAAQAFTVGNVVVSRLPTEELRANAPLLWHEARHASQWAVAGPLFLPLYSLASAWSWLRVGNPATANLFEQAAGLVAGGYVSPGSASR